MPTYFVSVIVPVFNDAERLQTCLAALERQTYPSNLYEVIVVDNGSDDTLKDMASQFNHVLTTYEGYPTSYAARNRGISLAKGDVIAFTDADCIPACDWIEKGVENLLRVPNCGLIAGKIELFFKNSNQPTAVERYESMRYLLQKEYIEKYRFGATANMWTLRSVIDDVGVFDPKLKSSGDVEWGERVFAAGYKQTYADDTCVAHPARYSLGQLCKQLVRRVGGEHDLKTKKGYSFIEFVADLVKDLEPPLKSICRVFLDKEISGLKQKSQVIYVMLLTRYIKALERVRLQLGGISQRC